VVARRGKSVPASARGGIPLRSYPINLVGLAERRCIVVGGGEVAQRKVESLLEAGAERVVVISPRLTQRLRALLQAKRIEHRPRGYRQGDLEGAFVVIAATGDPDVNRDVWQEAQERSLLINVVDDPHRCNFFVPSVVRRGDLTISISTGGQDPALSARLRQELAPRFGHEYAAFLEIAGALRDRVGRELSGRARLRFWYALTDSELLALLKGGKRREAERLANDILAAHVLKAKGGRQRRTPSPSGDQR
jgi:precorrin-2 dehydrogenase/sirohydrochlorin ferrochelatase